MNTAAISITRINSFEEQSWCAQLMAGSEPWISLKRTFSDGLALMQVTDGGMEAYIAKSGEINLGFVVIKTAGAFVGYVQILAVTEASRGRGIGNLLMDFVEQRIFEFSPNAFICVSDFNEGARKLYESRGYQLLGKLENYLETGFTELLLRKTIGSINDFRAKKLHNA
ncbi:MAG: GNAT family N-acetyltransferase [Chitinophagaceae bacterium]|nr:GNAT family N-acetyltransferase [Chitinophagaceae bacterium]